MSKKGGNKSKRKDAKGEFNGTNCAWRETHDGGSLRGFTITCCKPKVTCKYQGDPHMQKVLRN